MSDMDHLHGTDTRDERIAELQAEVAELRRVRTKTPRLGKGGLTRDMWWCECGRGLGESINLFDIHERWAYCPRCGASLDWPVFGPKEKQ